MEGVTAAKPEKQPRGLYLLFGVEMWERFSYYGMRALLVLFLTSATGEFGWTKKDASVLYGWYTGLVYLTGLFGGWVTDRWLGTHRSIIIGSVLIASGHFCLAVPGKGIFFVGLALIVIGTGFHKPIISTMVGNLFKQGDRRRDGAFTIFYMGINVGALLGPLVCGWLAEDSRFGWHWGFAAAGVGMVLGTAVYIALKPRILGTMGDVPAARERVDNVVAADKPLTSEERERIAAIAILAFFNIFFWSAFEQAGSSMNFFAQERTSRDFMGLTIPAAWFQSINSAVLLISAPFFAILWTRLAQRGREPSTPVKFVLALVFVGAGFAFLVVAARLSEGGDRVSPLWLTAAYAFHTWGELCLSPVGLSMVTKLAPSKLASTMMGLWWTSFFLSDLAAGLIASLTEAIEKGHYFTVFGGQADFFLIFTIMPILGAVLLLTLTPLLKKLMHGRA